MHNNLSKDVPKFDIELLFDEIGVLLDDNQYRDAISLVDMYHFYTRQHQVSVYFLDLFIAVGTDPTVLSPFQRATLISFHFVSYDLGLIHLYDPTSDLAFRCRYLQTPRQFLNTFGTHPTY
jgi:hypothetical protein